MSRICITDAFAVTALGPDLDSLYQGLLQDRTGIGRVNRFDTEKYAGPYAAAIQALDSVPGPDRIYRLADMLTRQIGEMDPGTWLITASTKGGIDGLGKEDTGPESLPFSLSLAGLADYLKKETGLVHAMNISAACASSTIAVIKGAGLIESGAAESVLVCCLDTVSEFVFSGFSSIGAMSPEPARPFDAGRTGLSLGEGAAAVLLMSEDRAKRLGKKVSGRISGWGITSDAVHLTAPDREGRGLKLAVRQACKKAGVSPSDIFTINTHGTATIHNDAMEIRVIRDLFDMEKTAANSIKGAVGHTLGAAGGIEIALCTRMLENRIMPGTPGLGRPEEDAEPFIIKNARPMNGDLILSTNSGFGGINAAVILKGE